ncbi:hypothetical protein C4577_05685 [Candidatus Parcubacteria bacterium]|nr:MAG: hypothetical protein C4577_05685 [Candidatus Parcubacteria bacterium]
MVLGFATGMVSLAWVIRDVPDVWWQVIIPLSGISVGLILWVGAWLICKTRLVLLLGLLLLGHSLAYLSQPGLARLPVYDEVALVLIIASVAVGGGILVLRGERLSHFITG